MHEFRDYSGYLGEGSHLYYYYDANGNIYTSSSFIGNVNPIRYRGYYYDTETGWYYLGTRYYDPQVKRFLNSDMIAGEIGSLGYNLYMLTAEHIIQ